MADGRGAGVAAAWLYLADGRPFACVWVQVPFPLMVAWQGRAFAWDANLRKYVEITPAVPAGEVSEAERPGEEV